MSSPTPVHHDAVAETTGSTRRATSAHGEHAEIADRSASARARSRRGPRALEIEAEATADALLAGATGLAARLTPAEAAPRLGDGDHGGAARASSGRPLAPSIRQRLEAGFGADLAAIRIHDDTAAHAIAAAEGAEAIAVGSHVYFGAGRYRPNTDPGLRLLAHETAHALQQTARRNADGGVAVTDISGTGAVQAADAFLDRFTGLDGNEILDLVTSDHAGADPSTSPIAVLVEQVKDMLPAGVDPTNVSYQSLVTSVTEGHHLATDPAELSYLLDLMKAGRQWNAAATLLDLDGEHQLGTAKRSSEFEAWLTATKGANWIDRIIHAYDPLQTLRDRIYGAFRLFLVRPDTPARRVDMVRFNEAIVTPADVPPILYPNERLWLAANHLDQVDIDRHFLCTGADRNTDRTTLLDDDVYEGFIGNVVFEGHARALRMTEELAEWAERALATGLAIYAEAAAWFESRTDLAVAFWSGALREWMQQVDSFTAGGRGRVGESERAERIRALDANPVAVKAAKRVSTAAQRFLDRDSIDVAEPLVHRSNAHRLFEAIGREIDELTRDLGDFKLTGDPTRYQIVPWLILRLELLRHVANAYDPADDTVVFDDTRQGHRLRVATVARQLAVDIDDMDLEEACLAIFGNEAAGKESRLVLISNWDDGANTDLFQLMTDFPNGVKLGDNQLVRAEAVVNFYRARFMREVADALEHELQPAYEILNKDTLLVKKALTAAERDVPMPTRWVVEDFDWAPNPYETAMVADIIRLHPKSAVQLPPSSDLRQVVYPGQDVFGSTQQSIANVFAWELPDFDTFIARAVQALAALDEFADLGPVDNPLVWWGKAQEHIESNKALGSLFTTTLSTEMRDDATVEEQRLGVDLPGHERKRLGVDGLLPGLLREATTHDRTVVAAQVAKLLTAFVEGDDVTYTNGEEHISWDLPNEALDKMHQFTRYAMPASDNIAQTAALVIEVAPALKAAFVPKTFVGFEIQEDRYDIITGYFGVLLLAEKWMDDTSHQRQLCEEFLTNLDETEFEARRKAATQVLTSFRDVRARAQRGRGFESTSAGGFRSLNYVSEIKPGDRFGYENATVELVRILLPEGKQFRFHPEYGFGDSLSPAQVIDTSSGEVFPPETELFEVIFNNEKPIVVRAKDAALLDHVWRAVEERAFQLAMQNVEAAMLEAISLALDVAEFIPGAGQALMVGRIVTAVAMFLGSADFEDIKEALTGEAIDQISRLTDEVLASLSPDRLWLFLLFDADTSFVDRLESYDSNSKRHQRLGRKHGKIGRLLQVARTIGTQFAVQFEAMRDRLQPPLRSTQSFVLTHPLLAQGFALAAEVIRFPPPEIATIHDIPDLAGDVNRRFDELLAAIEGFELPEEIVPLDLAVDAVLGILLDRLGAKGKIANEILRATGAREEVAGMIAGALDLAKLNPNDAWSGKGHFEGKGVKSLVDGLVNDARRDFLNGVNGALRRIGFTSLGDPRHQDIAAATVAHPASADDAAPSLAPGIELADVLPGLPTTGDIIPAGPGRPLPPRARIDAERHFGTGFGHVRLHRSDVADGVDALARGAHVVMRPGLSLTEGRGRDVLRHELAHVAEAPHPGRGTPGTRLRFDPAAERRADTVAATGRLSRGPGDGHDDASPELSDEVLAKVLDRLASFEDLKAYQTDVDAGDGDLPVGSRVQQDAMEQLRVDLIKALMSSTIPVKGVPSRMGIDTDALVRKHATDNVAPRVSSMADAEGEGFDRIVRRALVEVTKPKKGKQAQRGPRVYELDPKRFAALVEGYLLVRGGLQTNVGIDLKLAGDPELFLRKAEAGGAFSLEITGIFLGAVTKASGLWKPILDDQLAIGQEPTGTSDDEGYEPAKFEITGDGEQTRLFHALVSVIRREGPQANVLTSGYRIRASLLALAVDAASLPSKIGPDDLPRPDEYVSTTPGRGRNVGLRVGTHGELKKMMTNKTTVDRDSHHTTQFLFAEYFSMEAGPKPFADTEPGLEREGTKPKLFHRADGKGAAVKIAALRGGSERGGPMPAILIARPTHQRANLHVSQSPPRDGTDVTSSSSQANTVHHWFEDGRGATPTVAADQMPAAPDRVSDLPADSPARRRNLAVAKGIDHVYVEMRRTMLHALRRGLLKEEIVYYESIAARKTDNLDARGNLKEEWRLDPRQIERVYEGAVGINDKVMAVHELKVR